MYRIRSAPRWGCPTLVELTFHPCSCQQDTVALRALVVTGEHLEGRRYLGEGGYISLKPMWMTAGMPESLGMFCPPTDSLGLAQHRLGWIWGAALAALPLGFPPLSLSTHYFSAQALGRLSSLFASWPSPPPLPTPL